MLLLRPWLLGSYREQLMFLPTMNGRRRSGTAVVELAVVLPLLMLLLLGIWEYGRMIQVAQILSNSAREGARQAATGNKTAAQVDTGVKNYLIAAGITTTGYTVKVYNLRLNPNPQPSDPSSDLSTCLQMDHLRVNVTLPFSNVRWAFVNQLSNVTTLKGSADWYAMKDFPLVVDSVMPGG